MQKSTFERARGLFDKTSAVMVHSCNATQGDLLQMTHTAARALAQLLEMLNQQGRISAVSTKASYHPGLMACIELLKAHAIFLAVSGTKASKA